MDNLLQDIRYGIRTLTRQPGFAATAILTLALGIGATTAIFSVVNAVVLRPMPFDEPDRIVVVTNRNLKTGNINTTVSGPDFRDWREQSRSFEAIAHQQSFETSVTVNNASDYATTTRTSPGYFRVFGATAIAGRLFTPEEEQPSGPPVVVISDSYWRRQFCVRSESHRRHHHVRAAGAHDHRRHGVSVPGAQRHLSHGSRADSQRVAVGAQLSRGGEARAGRDRGAGAKRDDGDYGAPDRAISAEQRRQRRRGGAVAGRGGGRHAADAVRLAGGGGVRVVDRLRECRQPAAGARGGAWPRAGGAGRGRRRTDAPGSPDAHRERGARPRGRRRRRDHRALGRDGAARIRASGSAAAR